MTESKRLRSRSPPASDTELEVGLGLDTEAKVQELLR